MSNARKSSEIFDIAVIGAGISGIGAAVHLSKAFPDKKIVVLEGRSRIGGTWDLFRYPGVRSDSDLHTYGFEFKPWLHESAIAEGHLIREYLEEAAAENDIDRLIRYNHQVDSADWASDEALWTLQVTVAEPGARKRTVPMKARWVYGATGYYRYDEGYTPHFEGREDFGGTIIHPQHWPEDFDYAGKKVVVIGSGATAITMVPAMADGPGRAEHVTMLQRTPTYIMSFPRVDSIALALTKFLGTERGYAATRFKNVWMDWLIVKGLLRFPKAGRAMIRSSNRKSLPDGYDVDTHFNPPYNPWDQRVCLSPDGDFFKAISEGKASVVTDTIERFTKRGILLSSGREVEADVIVTATGLNMRLFGGIPQTVDGKPIRLGDTITYRGMLLSSVPNWAVALGYTKSSSWTLKVALTSRYVRELIEHMDANGYDSVVAVPEPGMETQPLLDLTAGYVTRAQENLPKQGTSLPWRILSSYQADSKLLEGELFDEHLHFGRAAAGSATDRGRLVTTDAERRS
ncbi:flavin-containing monooxygenase [Nocardia asteroides]|uniref:flavin-containing monooxygenase n=1 Tax=Nocardia asteroides TaxID=1824 RepID=UPI0037C806F7